MITNDGKIHIKRYLAGYVPSIAQSIAIGIGNKSESASDTKLQFEIGRADILLTAFDFSNNRLVFKAPVPEDFGGSVYEVAIYSVGADEVAGEFGSKLLTTFDEDEGWLNTGTADTSTFTDGGGRVGLDSLRQSPAANGSQTDYLPEMVLDLSEHSGADTFVFAFHARNANTSSIKFQFMTDTSNYYEFVFGTQTAGYKILEVTKSSATVTGSPDWESINEIRVITNSKSTGGAIVDFDAIRIEDNDTVNEEYVMVAREFLTTPFIKEEGKVQEVEFNLDINV